MRTRTFRANEAEQFGDFGGGEALQAEFNDLSFDRVHVAAVNSVRFSHDGELIASASDDETVRLWNTTTGEFIHGLCGHNGAVNSVCFTVNDRRLGSSSTK